MSDPEFIVDHQYTEYVILKSIQCLRETVKGMEAYKVTNHHRENRKFMGKARRQLLSFLHNLHRMAKDDNFTPDNVVNLFNLYNTLGDIEYREEKNSLEFTAYSGDVRFHIHINPKPES